MSYNNIKHVIIYFLLTGFMMYVLHAALQSIFIISLPMEEGWAVETVQTEERQYVTEFKNEIEQAKYYYNLDMLKRNKYLMSVEFLLAMGLGYLLFYFIPKWKDKLGNETGGTIFATIFVTSVFITFIVPLVYSLILPPPSSWFPSVFTEIHENLVNSELEHLNKVYGK